MADLVDVRLPAEQAEGTESVVAVWFKAVGESVVENEPLVEISTDKVTVEIAAPASGVLHEILKQEGEQIELGEVIGRIATGVTAGAAPVAASPAPAPSRPAPATTGRADEDRSPELTPAVRRLLKQHGLSASSITGTGTGGRISAQDVEAYLADGSPAGPGATGIPSRRVPHSQMRKSIAHHLAESVRAAPHVTTVFEVDLTAVKTDRGRRKAEFEKQGVRLTYTAYFVRATVEAIKVVPETNARWHPDALEIWQEMNIGIGTALEAGGLIVPVLRKAEDLDLLGIARAVADLAERARTGALSPADVQGGTFTISNHGVSGSMVATPIIINQPQSAILGVGKLEDRAVVRDGQVVVRPMAYVTLTIDHRVLDGFSANAFLTRWVEVLENWP
ncbi:MAG: 2-oxo acid dehydrogenase subunit E2 [Gemmatimonadota bacterium]